MMKNSYTQIFKPDDNTYSKRSHRSSFNNEDCFNRCILFTEGISEREVKIYNNNILINMCNCVI